VDATWHAENDDFQQEAEDMSVKVQRNLKVDNVDICKQKLTDNKKLARILHSASDSFKLVCQQECEQLVKLIHKDSLPISKMGIQGRGSYRELCSKFVVQKVESNLLGCCGQSCGWNGASCAQWPFIPQSQQEAWKEECCMEEHILRGSERELMCQSVLTRRDAEEYYALDLQPKDPGMAAFVGQDEELVWAPLGVKSQLGKPAWAAVGGLVSDGFLRWQPFSVQEGLLLKFWEIRKKTDNESQDTKFARSFLQMGTMSSKMSCKSFNLGTCAEHLRHTFHETCVASAGWRYLTASAQIQDLMEPQDVETPNHCTRLYPNKKLVMFTYNLDGGSKPIRCRATDTVPSPRTRRTSIVELGQSTEVDFTALRYVKLKV